MRGYGGLEQFGGRGTQSSLKIVNFVRKSNMTTVSVKIFKTYKAKLKVRKTQRSADRHKSWTP